MQCHTIKIVQKLDIYNKFKKIVLVHYYYCFHFYRAMLRRARLCHNISSICLSVRPSVTFRYRDHIGWNTLRIISRPNSLRYVLRLTQTSSIWSYGITPPAKKYGGIGAGSCAQKPSFRRDFASRPCKSACYV